MSGEIFGRAAILIARTPSQTKIFRGISPVAQKLVNRLDTDDVFRIGFNVERTSESNANTATISIYNLTETNRAFFESPKLSVILQAGYGQTPGVIFTGDIEGDKTRSSKSGPNIITSIESGDGRFALNNTVLNKTYAPGISVEQVLKDIQAQMKIGGNFKDIARETFSNGLSISGSVKEALNKLTEKQDLEWSIQNNALEIKKKNSPINNLVVQVSEDNGLVDIPQKTNEGIEFKTLLNDKLAPGIQVEISSKFFKAKQRFLIRRVQHQGDNFSGPWNSFVEAVDPSKVKSFLP